MSDPASVGVIDCLREQFMRVHTKLDNLTAGQHDLSTRVTSLEAQVALLHGDFANQSMRIDRVDDRLARIERRLELVIRRPADAHAARPDYCLPSSGGAE